MYTVGPIYHDHSSIIIVKQTITAGHSKQDQIVLVNIAKHVGFCVYRRSYQVFTMVPRNRLRLEIKTTFIGSPPGGGSKTSTPAVFQQHRLRKRRPKAKTPHLGIARDTPLPSLAYLTSAVSRSLLRLVAQMRVFFDPFSKPSTCFETTTTTKNKTKQETRNKKRQVAY